jgi:hypothetical protein
VLSFGFVFGLYFFEIGIERIEFRVPEFPVLIHPIRNIAQGIQFGFAVSFSAMLFNDHHAAFGQYFDMLGDRRATHIEVLRNGIEIHGFPGYQVDDLAASGVRNGLENIPSGF